MNLQHNFSVALKTGKLSIMLAITPFDINEILTFLNTNSIVHTLHINAISITPDFLTSLLSLPSITTLMMTYIKLSKEDVNIIASSKYITRLILNCNKLCSISPFNYNKTIRYLDLSLNTIDDVYYNNLVLYNKTIQTLITSMCQLSSNCLDNFKHNTTLTSIDLSSNKITSLQSLQSNSLEHIMIDNNNITHTNAFNKLPNLNTLELPKITVLHDLDWLITNANITKVSLCGNANTEKIIKYNTTLQDITIYDFNNNNIDFDDNKSLTHITLHYRQNKFPNPTILSSLFKNNNIRTLEIYTSVINVPDKCKYEFMFTNTTLHTLVIKGMTLPYSLYNWISTSSNVSKLSVSSVKIDDSHGYLSTFNTKTVRTLEVDYPIPIQKNTIDINNTLAISLEQLPIYTNTLHNLLQYLQLY